jgi:hypothetical protein
MGKDKIENLGFSEVNSWENETEVRKHLYDLFRGRKICLGNW